MKRLKHYFFVAILIAGLTAGIGLLLQQVLARMPLSSGASLQAVPMTELFGLHLWAIAFLFSLIGGILLYSVIVFRNKKGDVTDGEYIEGNTPLELFWTIVPLGAVLYIAFLGGQNLQAVELKDPNAMRIDVTGQQWSWRFDYPEYGITSDELYLPVDQQVLLRLRAVEVVHSFWVPEFGPKQDLLPGGLVRELRITPTKVGDYTVGCAELCGRKHAFMTAPVVVVSKTEFADWVARKMAENPCNTDDQIACGEYLARGNGCLACHSLDGSSGIGPTWVGIFGTEEALADGSTVTVDDAYILESVREPARRIVEGFKDSMPVEIGKNLTDEQIQAIIALIASLNQ